MSVPGHARTAGLLLAGMAMPWLLLATSGAADAAEGGTSFYLLGQRGQGAGILPPEGVFFALPNYFYSGDASGSQNLPIGGAVTLGLDADVFLTMPTAIWVTSVDLFGADLAFSATGVYGNSDVTANAAISIPDVIDRQVELSDDRWVLGDPVLGASLGWHGANSHYQLIGSVNIPAGDYDAGRLANTSLNRWAVDLTVAGTWLLAEQKVEISGITGVTFNGENDDTDYETGTEWHVEAALFYFFSPAISAGLNGYYYKQISGDSGAGATLGSFKGRVAGVGPGLTSAFQVGPVPITLNLTYYSEFSVKKRLEGDAVYLTASMPLWVPQ